MVIPHWFKKRQKHSDGYDPDAKDEQSGKEHRARREIRGTVLAEPLTDPTRKTRRSLLALSVLALIVNARLPIENLPYVGEQPAEESIAALLGVISIGVVYFLVNFIVSVGNEYLSWRLNGNFTLLRQTSDSIRGIGEQVRRINTQMPPDETNKQSANVGNVVREAASMVPDLSLRLRRTENYYVSTTRVQMIRIVLLEIALPLIVSLVALLKISALVWPMFVRIAFS